MALYLELPNIKIDSNKFYPKLGAWSCELRQGTDPNAHVPVNIAMHRAGSKMQIYGGHFTDENGLSLNTNIVDIAPILNHFYIKMDNSKGYMQVSNAVNIQRIGSSNNDILKNESSAQPYAIIDIGKLPNNLTELIISRHNVIVGNIGLLQHKGISYRIILNSRPVGMSNNIYGYADKEGWIKGASSISLENKQEFTINSKSWVGCTNASITCANCILTGDTKDLTTLATLSVSASEKSKITGAIANFKKLTYLVVQSKGGLLNGDLGALPSPRPRTSQLSYCPDITYTTRGTWGNFYYLIAQETYFLPQEVENILTDIGTATGINPKAYIKIGIDGALLPTTQAVIDDLTTKGVIVTILNKI